MAITTKCFGIYELENWFFLLRNTSTGVFGAGDKIKTPSPYEGGHDMYGPEMEFISIFPISDYTGIHSLFMYSWRKPCHALVVGLRSWKSDAEYELYIEGSRIWLNGSSISG